MESQTPSDEMCPRLEVAFRMRENLIHELERISGSKHVLVKEYRRSAAGRQTADVRHLRTRSALVKTTNYLLDEVCERKDVDWALVYEFVFDRLRAVRQDLVIQSINDENTVYILERCVHFYLNSISKLKHRHLNVFDPKINNTHIQESLKQLLVLYSQDEGGGKHKKRDEFESLYLLFNLNHNAALHHFLKLPEKVRISHCCSLAWRFTQSVIEHNYVRAFRLLAEMGQQQLSSLHYHLDQLQCEMLIRMNTAYSSKACKFPLEELCSLIGGKSREDMTSLLTTHGVVVNGGYVQFSKSMWKV